MMEQIVNPQNIRRKMTYFNNMEEELKQEKEFKGSYIYISTQSLKIS
jgi:predicted small secreted protein